MENEERQSSSSIRTQVTNLRIDMATLKTELTQFKWLFTVLSLANITLSIVVNVQVQ